MFKNTTDFLVWFFGWLVGFGFKDILGSKDTRVGSNPSPAG